MINGLPVVTAPAEIDVTTAEKLQMVLAGAAANGHAVIVVDLTGTLRLGRLQENTAATSLELATEELQRLDDAAVIVHGARGTGREIDG
jgi:hypothetical protein